MASDSAHESGYTIEPSEMQRARIGVRELRWVVALSIGCVTLLVFSPALRNGFVNWDDDVNIVENVAFRGLDASHLRWMFTTFHGGHYQPLTWLSFGLDHHLWELAPFGYHLTNIVMHAVGAVLFFFVAIRLLAAARNLREGCRDGTPTVRTIWCAAFAATLFALHPLRVESVAWVTERRDVLSGMFLFACVLAYLRAVEREKLSWGWFVTAIVLFAASLLSKASAMTLPIVLPIVDVYPLGRLRRGAATVGQLVAEKIPFACLSVAAAVIAMRAQQSAGAWRSLAEVDVLSRCAVACRGVWFYVLASLKPTDLSPLYRIPPREELIGAASALAAAGIVIVLVAAWKWRRTKPGVLVAVVCYLCILAPVSGLAQSGKQLVADRYSYLAMLPLALLLAGGLCALLDQWASDPPDSQEGKRKRKRKLLAALAGTYVVGLAALAAGQTTVWHDSVRLWGFAVKADPGAAVAWVNLGEALRMRGDLEQAEASFVRASELDDQDAKAFNGLGVSLLALNRPADALRALRRAVRLDPDNAKYLCNVGYVLAGFGQLDEAADAYRSALRSAPHWANASKQLSALLVELGRYEEAKSVLEAGLLRSPGHRGLMGDLAWLLATCPDGDVRNGEMGVRLASDLCKASDFDDPRPLDTLAAAYAEIGDFARATETAQRAVILAAESGETALATELRERLVRYEKGEPWRSQ